MNNEIDNERASTISELIDEYMDELDCDLKDEAKKFLPYINNSLRRENTTITVSIIYLTTATKEGERRIFQSKLKEELGVSGPSIRDCHQEIAESVRDDGHDILEFID